MPNSDSIQIYFNKEDFGDLKKRIERIAKKRSVSPYSRVSISEIARQLLMEKLDEEEGAHPMPVPIPTDTSESKE